MRSIGAPAASKLLIKSRYSIVAASLAAFRML